MKNCSECGAEYDDDMSFCLQDGTKLVAIGSDQVTEAVTEKYEIPAQTSGEQNEAVTDEWNNSDASKATVVKDVAQSTNPISESQTNVQNEPAKSKAGVVFGVIAIVGLLLFGSAIGGIFWYFDRQKTNDLAGTNINQATNLNSNISENGMRAEISNMEMPGNTNLSETKLTEGVNSEAVPTPKNSLEPAEIITPDKTATPVVRPSPAPTISETVVSTPTPKPTPDGPSRPISGGVLNGKATSLPQPRYPPAARAVNAKGSVSVQVLVDENGNVVRASAASGHPLLRNSSEQAAKRAKFRPTVIGGKAVRVSGVIVYTFN